MKPKLPQQQQQCDLDYHRAMQEAYQRQNPHASIPVYVQPHDYKLFLDYCTRHNLTASAAFHTLLNLT